MENQKEIKKSPILTFITVLSYILWLLFAVAFYGLAFFVLSNPDFYSRSVILQNLFLISCILPYLVALLFHLPKNNRCFNLFVLLPVVMLAFIFLDIGNSASGEFVALVYVPLAIVFLFFKLTHSLLLHFFTENILPSFRKKGDKNTIIIR